MVNKKCVILKESEWSRLKKQATLEKESKDIERESLKHLKDISQSWIKKWPDTIQGQVEKRNLIKRNQHMKDIAAIDTLIKRSKNAINTEAVEKARRMIFENSCYGKELTSALIASKTIEERDVQIQFKNKLKMNQIRPDNKTETNGEDSTYFTKHFNEKEEKIMRKLKNIEITEINKSICKMQKEKRNKEKQEEKEMQIDFEELESRFQMINIQEKAKAIEQNKKDIGEILANQKRIRDEKRKREELESKLNTMWRYYQDRWNCKEKHIHNEFHINRLETASHKLHYDIIKKLNEEKQRNYHEFVENSIKSYEIESKVKEQSDLEKQKTKEQNLKEINDFNKMTKQNVEDKVCHRQCVLPKSRKKKFIYIPDVDKSVQKLNKEKDKQPWWSGTELAHAQFVQYAKQVLKESKYKNMAQKVIENYMQAHKLDSTTFDDLN